ncbi:ferredoxin--NADP reductase [Nanoarchaeota archaeon]
MKLKIIAIKEEVDDVRTIRFDIVDKGFSFEAAQFVMVQAELEVDGEKKPVKRAYSISSSPTKKDYFEITVRRVPDGLMSSYLVQEIKEGDELEITGPFGKYLLDESKKNIFLIAGGVGIGPMRCFLQYVIDSKLDKNVVLLFSVRNQDEIIFKDELEEYENSNFKKIITLTREEDGTDWKGSRGRIDKKIIEENLADVNDSVFYICGSFEFANTLEAYLEELGVAKDNIHSEKWMLNKKS